MIQLRSAIFMYKANKNSLPRNLQLMFLDNKVNSNYNLRNKKEYYQKYVRTKQKQMCLSVFGIKLWNSLDSKIRQSETIYSFKSKYKYYLLNNY